MADVFVQRKVHIILMVQIKNSLKTYSENNRNSLFAEDTKVSVAEQKDKYEILAAEITTLGGLLQSSKENR